MTSLIPAAPGWYLQHYDGTKPVRDPIVAWTPGQDRDGDDILLPFVDAGPGLPPTLMPLASFEEFAWTVVYLPNYDPGARDR